MQESTVDTSATVPPEPSGSWSVTVSGGVVGTNRSASGTPRTVSSNLLVADPSLLGLSLHRMLPVVHFNAERATWQRSGLAAALLRSTISIPFAASTMLTRLGGVLKEGPLPLKRSRAWPDR